MKRMWKGAIMKYQITSQGVNATNQIDALSGLIPSGYALGSYVVVDNVKYYILPEEDRTYIEPALTLNATGAGLCQTNGSITATVTGGIAPYKYEWSVQSGTSYTLVSTITTNSTTNTLTGAEAGQTYLCTVTDQPGTVVHKTITVPYTSGVTTGLNIWSGSTTGQTRYFSDGFYVPAGQTLTLTNCTCYFGDEAKVEVRNGIIDNNNNITTSGGKLVLNNTTFTVAPGCDMWKGVEVWGYDTKPQFYVAGKIAQGQLIMNTSAINYARNAVELWKPGYYAMTGGIIKATNSNFLNNGRAIHANDYEYTSQAGIAPTTVSYARNCVFAVNSGYPGTVTFSKHVDLARINGFQFTGCDFSVAAGAPNVATYNLGIAAYDAGFKADYISIANPDKCNFTGHYAGVYASKGTSTYTFSVKNSVFTNNAIGIYVNGVTNESVLFNQFYLKASPAISCNGSIGAFGIDMLGSTGFAIEENTFQKASGAPVGKYVGIRCKDSQTTNDVIYKNQFTGLSYGNYAEGENRLSGPGQDYNGLQFQCNLNQNNAVDFIVAKDLTISNPPDPFIHSYQGKPELEAGNTFSANPVLYGSFMNMGTQIINYFYRTNPPVSVTPIYVILNDNAGVNTCPSHYGGGGSGDQLVLSNEAKLQKETDFASNQVNFNNVKALFDNLKDGGNTEGLKLEVETSWPSEMWDLRAELLEKSPHLSQEVLMEAADKTEVLPESVLFEILSANPDELRKEELLAYLENKAQPLPDYLISILRQLAGGITYKTALQMNMATYHANKTQAAYDLIRSALADSVTDYQYLRTWYGNLDNLQADYDIVAAYLAEGNYTAAQTKLESIPVARAMEGTELNMFYDYKNLTLMQIGWEQQGVAITQLDSSTVASLVGYAESGTGKASLMARAILEYGYGYHFNCCIPENNPSTLKLASFNKSADDNGLQLSASPNPASTWVAFDYKLPIPATKGVLLITDMSGKAIRSFNLNMSQGQQVWDTRGVDKGTYLYVLKAGNASKQGKIIIQ